jgi:2-methylcitrate dehydratase PrpD
MAQADTGQKTTQETTQVLAQFASGLRYDDIPPKVKEHCKHLLLDAIACAIAGDKGEETPQMTTLAAAIAQSKESSVIAGGHLSLAGATLLNGYLITAVTMCDAHRPTMAHVTPEVVPPALAIAERDNLSGRDLLVALAAGCEVLTRIGIALDYAAFRPRGWHAPGVLGPFGAAAAVGRLRGLKPEAMARAFGLAGSQAAGTYAAWATPSVKFHQCRGGLSGLLAALLAETDFVATKEFLTAKDGGLFNTYGNGGKPELATNDLGKRWELEQIALRAWPSASLQQGLNTALFDIIEQHQVDPASVKHVRVAMSQSAFDYHGKLPKYKGKFEALISAHYTAAVIVHDRALTLAQFEPARYDDPKVRRFAEQQIEIKPDSTLNGVQTTVEIELSDGKKLSSRCDHPRGSFENPLSRVQIEDKFRTYGKSRLPAARLEETLDAINRLEDFPSVRKLMDLLQVTQQAKGERAA